MNVDAIRNELAKRLRTVVVDAYSELPASPEFPCAIVSWPVVSTFHTDMAHSITRLDAEVRVFVGRGDTNEAQRQLGEFVSTDTDKSVLKALEASDPKPEAWIRLKAVRTSDLLTEGDAIGVAFTLEIDA
jgi:hypothetical protein